MIVPVSVVLRGTVVDNSDWNFHNLSESYHQSQVNNRCQSKSGKLIGQLSYNVNGSKTRVA